MTTADRDWPGVSVIMPVLNEERHLAEAVRGVLDQHYPGPLELIMAIGPSRDRTHEIAERLCAEDDRLVIVENPAGRTPSALNRAIAASHHDVVVRVDGHGELTPGYITGAVELLERTGAVNVGGVMDARGVTAFEQAVAYAYTSRLGIGGAKFHLEESAEGEAETVFLGVFRKQALLAAGGFDESMHRAQDWELNYRLRRAGGLIWFSPRLKVTYRPRSSFRALISQFYATGRWRREVVRRHSDTLSRRYLAPPVATAGIAGGTAAALLGEATGRRWLRIGWLAPLGYAALVTAGAVFADRDLPPAARARLPFVLASMHLAWGAGFIVGLPAGARPEPHLGLADHES